MVTVNMKKESDIELVIVKECINLIMFILIINVEL